MSQDKNPTRTARREARRRRRLPPNSVCATCGEDDPTVLELHHVMGRAHSKLEIVQCKNCHAKATEGQRREQVPLAPTKDFPNCLAAMLDALAAFFRHLANAFNGMAERIRALAKDLLLPAERS